jgi:small-conductance mechanosensitive channel
MESSLQQTGFIGIILAFLALTSSHWLPNIVSGLTLMNSNHIVKGDIVKFEDSVYSVFDIGFFYTHLLDIKHNSRVLIENSVLSKKEITNISKKAGLQGYRDSIVYNIAYPPMTTEKAYDDYISSFESIFEEIFEEIDGNENYALNYKSKYDLLLIETADYALRYEFFFYYKDLKVSTTANIRKTFSTKFKLNALVQKKSHLRGISLSTPMLIDKPEKPVS